MNIRHRISRFGKLIANILWLFAGELLRDTVDCKILCIDAVLFAKHIAYTNRLKAHIRSAVTVAVDGELCVAKFLCYALSDRYAVSHITLNIQGLFLVVVKRRHIGIRKLICCFYFNRRRIQHNGNECFRVTIDSRCRRSFAVGLRNIKDLFHIVGNAGCTVSLCILDRFKNGNAFRTFLNFHIILAPVIKVFELACFGKLLENQKCIDRRVSVETALRIKEGFELFRVGNDRLCGVVRHLIYGFFFRFHLLGIFLFGKSFALLSCLSRGKIVCHCDYLSFTFLLLGFGCWCAVCAGAFLTSGFDTSGSLRSASFCCLD